MDSATPVATRVDEDKKATLLDQGLDRDAFLKIFLTQLEHQDPLNPQDTSEMSAQLAQFSQLEQALRTTTELEGVNQRLDQLIEDAGMGTQKLADLDPVRLIGREVEVDDSTLRLPDVGTSSPLRITLDEPVQLLQVQAQSPEGDNLAVLQLAPQGGVDVPAGTYEVLFIDGEPHLRGPAGTTVDFPFVAQDGEGNPFAFPFQPGATYQFAVGANDLLGAPIVPSTTTSGRVDAVHNEPTGTKLSVNGHDIDFSKIIRIR